jgi:hypothetical protein
MGAGRSITSRRCTLALAILAASMLALALGAGSALAASSWWHLGSGAAPTNLTPGGEGQIFVSASDLGYEDIHASEEHPVLITDTLPAGLQVSGEIRGDAGVGGRGSIATKLKCETAGQTVTCRVTRTIAAYEGLEVIIPVKVSASLGQTLANAVKIEGGEGGVAPASLSEAVSLTAGGETRFGVEKYELTPESSEGQSDLQAGGHPFQLTTTLNLNDTLEQNLSSKHEEETTPALVRDLHFVLPPGLLGNVTVVPQCTSLQFATIEEKDVNQCASDTAVGVARVKLNEPKIYGGALTESVPVFNLVPAQGEPARFGIEVDKVPVILNTAVKAGSSYAVEVSADVTTQAAALLDTQVTFWGVPADPRHDHSRGWECVGDGHWDAGFEPERPCKPLGAASTKPFLTLPTSCAEPPVASVTGDSWPTGEARTVYTVGSEHARYQLPSVLSHCDLEGFAPAMSVEAESHAASTPSGFTVKVHVPQESTLAAGGVAEADVRETILQLPVGVQASPAAANGLLACTGAEFGLEAGIVESLASLTEDDHFSGGEAACPQAAKIGTVTVRTPLLEHELSGGVYLASQDTSPFTSPLVLYVFAEDPISGVRVKLAGEVQVNQSTGQLTSYFKATPPVPFEDLTLKLFGGPRASQSTPPQCGTYTSQVAFKPWSASASMPAVAQSSQPSFQIVSGAEGGPCPSNPQAFAPAFEAGPTSAQAAGFTDFTMNIAHPDSNQPLNALSVSLPQGVAALLSSVSPCREPAAGAEWSCGAESLIGTSTASSGLGGDPFTLTGNVYLTSGYDGAPFGLLVSTLAKAGPFDLGYVNVRSRIDVNPTTAAVTITTDPGPRGEAFPTIIKGIPTQIKQINVTVNRPNFQFNPTNCAPAGVTGALGGAAGASEPVSHPYPVVNCSTLPFAPKLTASAGAHASKKNGASLNVKIESAGLGQANIRKVFLTIPRILPTRQETLQLACVAATFEANPAACGEGSVIGTGTVHTPVLKSALTGPAYLVSHGGAGFPDVEFVLQGEGIKLILDGHTQITKGVTYSRFETAPDAPFTSFETSLPTGPHSILTAYTPSHPYNLCGTSLTIPTEITGQNGAVLKQETPVAVTGCTPSIQIAKTHAQARALLVTVVLSQAGSVTIAGKGLKTSRRSLSAGSHTIKVALTKAGLALARHHRKLHIKATVRVAGRSYSGSASVRA